jgi:hypothetical protein
MMMGCRHDEYVLVAILVKILVETWRKHIGIHLQREKESRYVIRLVGLKWLAMRKKNVERRGFKESDGDSNGKS